MNGFGVRVAIRDDADNVSSLLQTSYPVLMKPAYDQEVLVPALDLMTNAQPALLASGTYYVAESEEKFMVGCGGWTKEYPGQDTVTESIGHLRHFGTHPDWTKRGVGRAIYSRCEADAQNAGITTLECVSALNSEGFYAALGFKRVCVIDIEMAPNVVLPSVQMYRSI